MTSNKQLNYFSILVLITCSLIGILDAKVISTCARKNSIALTFDDGPSLYYEKILDILKDNDIKATFFLIGNKINDTNLTFTKRAIKEGHNIGSHTYSHPHLPSLKESEITTELNHTNKIIQEKTGLNVEYFRPPYGEYNADVVSISEKLGQKVILWNIDTVDWENVDSAYPIIKKKLQKKKHKSSIILMHGWTGISEYLRSIINLGKKKGYKFVNMDECLKASD